MKSSKWPLWFVILVFWFVGSARGQTFGLEKVAGKGATVELCSEDYKKVLASTKTNDNGYFSFEKPPGKLFHLRFSSPSPGVNPLQVKACLSKHAAKDELERKPAVGG